MYILSNMIIFSFSRSLIFSLTYPFEFVSLLPQLFLNKQLPHTHSHQLRWLIFLDLNLFNLFFLGLRFNRTSLNHPNQLVVPGLGFLDLLDWVEFANLVFMRFQLLSALLQSAYFHQHLICSVGLFNFLKLPILISYKVGVKHFSWQ